MLNFDKYECYNLPQSHPLLPNTTGGDGFTKGRPGARKKAPFFSVQKFFPKNIVCNFHSTSCPQQTGGMVLKMAPFSQPPQM